MESSRLPADLEDLEQALSRRPLPELSPLLRQKVLDGLPSPLRRQRSAAGWQFAVAVAATALFWLNLSLTASRITDCGLRWREPSGSIETASRQIAQLLPGLSPEESRREAVLLRAGSALTLCLDLSGNRDVTSHANRLLGRQGRAERSP
jgi:hypothetical protein